MRCPAARLEKEPHALFRLMDPLVEEIYRRDIAVLPAEAVNLAHRVDERPVVLHELTHHVARRDERFIAVIQALQLRDVSDGPNRRPAEHAYALGDDVRHGKDIFGLLLEKEVVIAEVRPAHMPVE